MTSSRRPTTGPTRPNRTIRGWLLRGGAALAVAGLLVWMVWQNVNVEPSRQWASPRKTVAASAAGPSAVSSARRTAAPVEALKQIEPCVVRIESDGVAGLEIVGSGFVVTPEGLVATSYHVAAGITQGMARFRDGTVHEIAGYAALDR